MIFIYFGAVLSYLLVATMVMYIHCHYFNAEYNVHDTGLMLLFWPFVLCFLLVSGGVVELTKFVNKQDYCEDETYYG